MTISRGLGKGLSALLGEDPEEKLDILLVDNVFPDESQPRTVFVEQELQELQDSIAKKGVLQPILVRPSLDGEKYIIVAGERRWRAVQNLGLVEIPAIVKKISDIEAFEMAIIENIQRENLSPLDEAAGYRRLIDQHNYTQEKIAETVSKSRSHIANLLRLCNLSDKAKAFLQSGYITLGHAKILASLENSEEVVEQIVKNKLNVRDTEKFLQHNKNRNKFKIPPQNPSNNEKIEIAEILTEELGIDVEIHHWKQGSRVIINCENIGQLDLVVRKLSGSIG